MSGSLWGTSCCSNMSKPIVIGLMICAIFSHTGFSVSTKVDFDNFEESRGGTNYSSTTDDDDVEVKHTIVLSTRLKNNNVNRKGIRNSDGDSEIVTYNIGRKDTFKDDINEVPVIKGYKAVETTEIKTPDTRQKPVMTNTWHRSLYPESIMINRNIRDDYDIYPNMATNPVQWKPINQFNNINWWNPEVAEASFLRRLDRPGYQNPGKLHKKISDDGPKEFYCRKCRELNGFRGCSQRVETTTARLKIDGKLAKLN